MREQGGNTEYWRGGEVTGFERKQRLLIKHKNEGLRAVAEVLPFQSNWKGRILDIGAGQGSLSRILLTRFPQCHVTLFDASEEMLAVARERLSGFTDRTKYIASDFNASGWYKDLCPPYDAIVSSIALHYLAPRKRPAFFRHIYRLLQPNGWFVDLDSFSADDPVIEQRMNDIRLRFIQRQLRRLEGRKITLETLASNDKNESGKAGVCRTTLNMELAHLKEAGFTGAECIWRIWRLAMIVAHKPD